MADPLLTARQKTIADFKANLYKAASKTLMYSVAQAEAFGKLAGYYGQFFSTPDTRNDLRPSAITDPQQIRQLTACFSWSATAEAAGRSDFLPLWARQSANFSTCTDVSAFLTSLVWEVFEIAEEIIQWSAPSRQTYPNA